MTVELPVCLCCGATTATRHDPHVGLVCDECFKALAQAGKMLEHPFNKIAGPPKPEAPWWKKIHLR